MNGERLYNPETRIDCDEIDRFKATLEAMPERPRPPRFDAERREDAISALTLARTVAFLMYSMLAPLITLIVLMMPPFPTWTRQYLFLIAFFLFTSLEYLLFVAVQRGWLPSPDPEHISPFSERQIEFAALCLSVTPWLLHFDPSRFLVFQGVINGSLIIAGVVFFITKSMLSRRWRWGVLRVLVLPALQLAWLFSH